MFHQEIFKTENQQAAIQQYKPIALWSGRLILPTPEQRQPDGAVLIEIHNAAPAFKNLIGKIIWLRWHSNQDLQNYLKTVTKNVEFTPETLNSKKNGNIYPQRLNKLQKVGPLESLAGAHLQDDVIVMLSGRVEVSLEQNSLIIREEPIIITGKITALITIIQPFDAQKNQFLVRHYNKTSNDFDGPWEIIEIPQTPPNRVGYQPFTNHLIEKSPLNNTGWYIYGERNSQGMFVVKAIEPREIFLLKPSEIRCGLQASQTYLKIENWNKTPAQKGLAKTTLLAPNHSNQKEAIAPWKEGDKAIVIHLFGGIGGQKAEPHTPLVITGHFSYGIATVIKDPFTDELRFDIVYWQVYTHNPEGIISAAVKWQNYMGDLQIGWAGARPVSDILVKFEPVTKDYQFDKISLSPIAEFTRQLQIITARYRIGDGTGAAILTPAKSCVQDSNQALYVTLKKVQAKVMGKDKTSTDSGQILEWLLSHPNHSEKIRFDRLENLAKYLEKNLVPLGIVQPDWRKNLEQVSGVSGKDGILKTFFKTLTTWRTMLPRRTHDEIAMILLKNGADLWVLRSNQIGGFDPEIEPLAPTGIFGHRRG